MFGVRGILTASLILRCYFKITLHVAKIKVSTSFYHFGGF